MALTEGLDGAAERGAVKGALEPAAKADVVRGCTWKEMLQKPDSVLLWAECRIRSRMLTSRGFVGTDPDLPFYSRRSPENLKGAIALSSELARESIDGYI
ncbi:hypothetical protein [Streptomyces sp. SID13031]|uniref:hypothetical protein n=1 Tax=Streptomyces sp. SID13031 TaxID=2706046 RepID=UPI0013CB1356|nr:hypothetical protein [Streptomyces sp. SID13031]NEA32498.1 hypothetical protein [Streptomyces sp. SID13031]